MNYVNDKIKSYAWESFAKGLAWGIFLGAGIEAVIIIILS
jgi:hypothetical protein